MFIYLTALHNYMPGFGVFQYISFRAIAAMLTAAFIVFLLGDKFVIYVRKWQGKGQPIRADGPQTHFEKSGTPTMGGLMILGGILLSSLLWGNLTNLYFWIVLFVAISFAAIGFYDDYLKVMRQNEKGFSSKARLGLEFLIAVIAVFLLLRVSSANISVPFIKSYLLNLGWFFLPFAAIVIVGTANSVNFTDGLDGLAIVPVMIAACSFACIAYFCGNLVFAKYLQIPFVPGAGEMSIILAALIGSGLGFLWFNAPPAAMFMGDTGSLSLGGLLGCIAVATKQELILVIIGGIFVMEALSVIIQVLSFKTTGKRVFLMAPIHHHFEKKGWSESQVVIRFWIIAIFLALIGLLSFKLR
ncbi:MAG: phospho-N-acetylmuramoyl-pentapeptide-transferase [Alphaproteobacteria bacterium]|nr:phospho-N-acetylmuramoyl-pentapeptide-transferase [Alphaproteobacteria bacterium]